MGCSGAGGEGGRRANVCAPGAVGDGVAEFARRASELSFRMCVPEDPFGDASLVVTRVDADGEREALEEGSDGDVHRVPDSQCPGSEQALIFHPLPEPGDSIEMRYEKR